MNNPRKILVIRFSALGDLVLTSPIFRELKRIYPDYQDKALSLITTLTLIKLSGTVEMDPVFC